MTIQSEYKEFSRRFPKFGEDCATLNNKLNRLLYEGGKYPNIVILTVLSSVVADLVSQDMRGEGLEITRSKFIEALDRWLKSKRHN
jgi:hypothetical protein